MAGSLHHRALIPLLIFGSGVAALSWELLWQHHASLALGVSAKGTAITLATTMAGMAIGSRQPAFWEIGHMRDLCEYTPSSRERSVFADICSIHPSIFSPG